MPDDAADSKTIYVRQKDFMAGIELFGVENLNLGYFDPVDPVPDLVPGELLRHGEAWGNQRMALGIFATSYPEWTALAIGDVPTITGKVIPQANFEKQNLPSNWGLDDFALQLDRQFKENFERVVFMPTDTVNSLIGVNRSDVMRADILPGKGLMSHSHAAFAPMITSTGQRPDILLTEEQERIFSEGLRSQGCRFEVVEPEAPYEDIPSP